MKYLEARCPECNKKLFEAADGSDIEIKCPRCGIFINIKVKAKSVKHTAVDRE